MSVLRPRYASVIFDADSTLVSIEGIDWLGAQRGEAVGRAVQELTNRSMAGELAIEVIYASRLDLIKPTQNEIALLAQTYVAAVEPGARALIGQLQRASVHVVIVSGGLRDALLPLADWLGVPRDHVHAVALEFDSHGNYVALANGQPLAQQDGKPRVVRGLSLPRESVMIGDGSTDAAVRGETDAFIAYTHVARRPLVVASADAEARDFSELTSLLFES